MEAEQTVMDAPKTPAAYEPKVEQWKSRIAAAEKNRDKLLEGTWRNNVNARVQRPQGGLLPQNTVQGDRLSIPEDWARTKQKAAQLNYQLPKIVAKAKHPDYEAKAPLVTADLNDILRYECQASYMMDECLADVINAAGIMVSKIGLDRQTETIEMDEEKPREPIVGPLGDLIPDPRGPEIVKTPVTKIVSQRFYWDRVSPADFLWPAEFRLSNWSQAPWLGIQTYMTLEQAKKTFKKLPADFETTVKKPKALTKDLEDTFTSPDGYVKVTEIWYYAWLFDPDKAHPECIRRLVMVEGYDKEPVEFEATDWQEWVPEIPEAPAGVGPDGQPTPAVPGRPGYYKGLRKLPIRVETLTYVSDMAVPPSDSEAGRPQVRELLRSRAQMLRQRDSSIPVRWFNVNLVDPDIEQQLKNGEWQDFIPMNGPGDRAIGEVARASYPRENFEFVNVIGNDLDRAWSLSNNQLATTNAGQRSATEINTVQSAGQIRLDYEKSRVNRYLVEGAEVLFSLMQKFRNGTKYVRVQSPQGEVLQPVSPEDLAGEFMFDMLVDSGDRIDTVTKQNNALKMWNLLAGYEGMNKHGLAKEIVELHGMEVAKVVGEPPKPQPPPPNVSYRFSGEDFLNPMVVAIAMKSNPITPEEIEAAAMMIKDAQAKLMVPQPAPIPPGPGPAPQQGVPEQPVEPPETAEPILKRAADGSRLM